GECALELSSLPQDVAAPHMRSGINGIELGCRLVIDKRAREVTLEIPAVAAIQMRNCERRASAFTGLDGSGASLDSRPRLGVVGGALVVVVRRSRLRQIIAARGAMPDKRKRNGH